MQQCEDLGRLLKRNKVSIDIINFANPENAGKLEALVNAANMDENCHFLNVPSDFDNIEGVLISSSILNQDFGGDMGGGLDGVGGMGEAQLQPGVGGDAGIGMDMDPDLARALQLSLQDNPNPDPGESAGVQTGQLKIPDAADAIPTAINQDMDDDSEDEEEQLRKAIELSKMEDIGIDGEDDKK